MHHAINAIVPVYAQYTPVKRDVFAHPIAAAAQAAHDVLPPQYPGQEVHLDTGLAHWLSQVPNWNAPGARYHAWSLGGCRPMIACPDASPGLGVSVTPWCALPHLSR
jgi:hypothetical protein